jgi:hypothetical protein
MFRDYSFKKIVIMSCVTVSMLGLGYVVSDGRRLLGYNTISQQAFTSVRLGMCMDEVYALLGPEPRDGVTIIGLFGHVDTRPLVGAGSKKHIKIALWEGWPTGNVIIVWYDRDDARVVEKEWRPFGEPGRRMAEFIDDDNRWYRSTYIAGREQVEELPRHQK